MDEMAMDLRYAESMGQPLLFLNTTEHLCLPDPHRPLSSSSLLEHGDTLNSAVPSANVWNKVSIIHYKSFLEMQGRNIRSRQKRTTDTFGVNKHQYICGSRPLSPQTPVTSALVSVTSWVGVSCRSFPFSKSMSEDNELGASQSGQAVSKVPLDVWHLVTAWLEPLGLLKLSMVSLPHRQMCAARSVLTFCLVGRHRNGCMTYS
ncbi:uncharacterized protein EI90DRAFT_3067012 [Cantharellus anzutake]|uniref:uncharacterized protein n=1 Tax=Cantharellus anzutake TaxID=1750568 RepID=UPI0019046B41|nr:uncharacterized protein EI90DRAFT_3067012 [Cantharellus anzutake]KAF8327788.1 hypothetical protein EI90DRAFT_3067012 [Cantharellus anzutake]